MNLISVLSYTALLLALTSATPLPQDTDSSALTFTASENLNPSPPKCKSPAKRKAWQALTPAERRSYLTAELCLQRLPSRNKLPGAKSRFDDLVKAHQIPAVKVHGSGYFLPFHRAFINAHEKILREECGYRGWQPYWAEEVDIGRIEKSELLRPDAFGGSGKKEEGWCVKDGLFKDYLLTTGPGFENTPHCLKRNIQNNPTWGAGKPWTDHCKKFDKFIDFTRCIEESGPHIGFHAAIGIELNNPISSPGDPLFYLHHTWIDKVWYDWQLLSPRTRLHSVAGRKNGFVPGAPDSGPPLPGFTTPGGLPSEELFPPHGIPIFPLPEDFTWPKLFEGFNNTWMPPVGGDPIGEGDPVGLGDVLEMFGTVRDVTVGSVTDTKGGYLCYEYQEYKEKPKGPK